MTTPPLDTTRPFRAKDARTAGISRRRLGSAAFTRLGRGVYVAATAGRDPLHAARAAVLLAGRESFASHQTAARLYGGVVPDTPDLHAGVPPHRHRSRAEGVVVHQSRREAVRFRGVPVTSAIDTFLDLSAGLSLVDLVVLGDSLVRRGRFTPAQLVAASEGAGRRARRAAALVRAGVDSPMETRIRLLLVLAGLPEPEVNIEFRDGWGEVQRRLDMGYRAARLGIEYDGNQHAESTRQYQGDVRRREEFAALGWGIWTAVSADLYGDPGGALDRVVAMMRQRGMRVRRPVDGWRRHFPGRA